MKNKIFVPDGANFNVLKTEKVIQNTNTRYKETFFSYYDEIKVPLFKIAEGRNYTIFTCIPFNTTLNDLCQSQQVKSTFILNSKDFSDDTICYRSYSSDAGNFFAEYITTINKNLFYILVNSKDPKIIENQFSKENIKKRFIN